MIANTSAHRRSGAFRMVLGALALAATAALSACASLMGGDKQPEIGLYEVRVYTAAEGKMD